MSTCHPVFGYVSDRKLLNCAVKDMGRVGSKVLEEQMGIPPALQRCGPRLSRIQFRSDLADLGFFYHIAEWGSTSRRLSSRCRDETPLADSHPTPPALRFFSVSSLTSAN